VRYTINRYKKTESHENLKRSGRKRITSAREGRQLVRTSLKNRKKTSFELTADLFGSTEKKVSARTVRRRLQNAGLKGCKARKKPWLSDKNKKKRLQWFTKISLRRIGRILCGRTSLTSKYVHFMNPNLFETHYNNRGTSKIIISCPLEV